MRLDPSAFVADPELFEELSYRSSPLFCGGDRVLFHQGETPAGLYIVNKGKATLTAMALAGDDTSPVRVSAGSILGLPELLFSEPSRFTATARKDADVRFVSRAEFEDLVHTDPRLSLLDVLAREIRSLSRPIPRPSIPIVLALESVE
jgi:CRP-like cAMP-binding protein